MMRTSNRIFFALSVCALLILGILAGCASGGGGTEGSGLRNINGTATDEANGNPVAAVTVTILETGESDVTDADGKFEIPSNVTGDQITLEFEDPGTLSTQAVVNNLPPGDAQLDVRVDRPNNHVEVKQVTVPPTSTAIPNPTVAPQASPSATATVSALLPTSTPTAIPTPTPTPYVPSACDCDVDGVGGVTANDYAGALDRYVAGNFDFNRDGVTDPDDMAFYQSSCEPLQGQPCP